MSPLLLTWSCTLRATQVDELTRSRGDDGRGVLYFAAKSGSKAMVETVLDVVGDDEVCIHSHVHQIWCTPFSTPIVAVILQTQLFPFPRIV